MKTISPLISHHRAELKAEARLNRYLLLGAIFMALVSFSVFISTLLGHYPLPFGEDLFAENPERMIGASNFFVATSHWRGAAHVAQTADADQTPDRRGVHSGG